MVLIGEEIGTEQKELDVEGTHQTRMTADDNRSVNTIIVNIEQIGEIAYTLQL